MLWRQRQKRQRLSWKCRRHVAKCRHDMTCRSNFGQMGPCRRHKIEDVVAVCVGLSRHLTDFPKCVCRNILYGMGVHTHRYYRTSLNAHFCHVLMSCSPVCHVLQQILYQKVAGDNAHPHKIQLHTGLDRKKIFQHFAFSLGGRRTHSFPSLHVNPWQITSFRK